MTAHTPEPGDRRRRVQAEIARIRAERQAFETKVLDALTTELAAIFPREGVSVDSVTLETLHDHSDCVVILVDGARPHCRFGWRALAWPPVDAVMGTPEAVADLIGMHLEEEVAAASLGLPRECSETGITWPRPNRGDA